MDPDPNFLSIIIFSGFTFKPITINVIVELIILLCLLISSALISGSEVAFFSLNPKNLEDLDKSKSKTDKVILKLHGIPENLLATILVVNNLINVGIVILSSFITVSIVDFSNARVIGFIIQVVVITFIILLFGEIIPKVYAAQYSVRFAQFMAYPVNFLEKLFRPVNFFLISSTSIVNKRFQKKYNISIDDLSEAINITTDDIQNEKKILKGIVKFGNIDVKEIMRSRIDVVAIEIDTKYDKLLALIIESGYSRIPVYEETFDTVKGILYVKDLLSYLNEKPDFKWQQLIKTPYFVPDTKKIDDLLEEFRKNKTHMAIVVDEYGGTSGIITMEDIIEEIVGEIDDEKDAEEFRYYKIDDNNYIFEGKTLLVDFYKITNSADTIFADIKGEAETLAGLVLEIKGEIPQKKDKVVYKNYEFLIDTVDSRRIKKIKVKINPV